MAIVETTAGKVQGTVADGVHVFKGIPFGAPPVGELRFRPPQPAPSWEGVRQCRDYGRVALQSPSPLERLFSARPPEMDENCLSLNVWTPACDDGKRPVMVWIHGGAFLYGTGATPWYDGRTFARSDVVLVTINYRLGALGFLHVDGQGNNGILDQVAALEWVRDNVDAFGKGQAAGVRVLVGTTRDEWRLFTMLDPGIANLDDAGAAGRIAGMVSDASRAADVVAHYRASRPDAGISDLWSALGTDVVFRIPAVRLAEKQSALGNDVYMYRFDFETPVFGGVLGACHALEIPFVFDSLGRGGTEMFVGEVDDRMRTLARRMHDSWVAFARPGRPEADGLPEWPQYTEQRRATMLFGLEQSVVDDPGGDD